MLRDKIRFLSENGAYLYLLSELQWQCQKIHNRFLAAKLGVRRVQIGPGAWLRGLSAIQIGENFSTGPGLRLDAITLSGEHKRRPLIVIGDNVFVNSWCHITATNSVEIGDNVLMGSKVIVTDHQHGQYSGPHTSPEIPPALRPLDLDKKVVIGRNVWLGDGVVVMPGSEIGEGSIIGANSVVVGKVPPFTIAAGIPSKPLKRYDFQIKEWVRV